MNVNNSFNEKKGKFFIHVFIKQKLRYSRLERWLSSLEHLLLFWRIWVWFPAPITGGSQPNWSSRRPDTPLWPLQVYTCAHTYMCTNTHTSIHMHVQLFKTKMKLDLPLVSSFYCSKFDLPWDAWFSILAVPAADQAQRHIGTVSGVVQLLSLFSSADLLV